LSPGEQIVAAGSFALRAERDRLGLGAPRPAERGSPTTGLAPHDDHRARSDSSAAAAAAAAPAAFRIEVGANGFTPSAISIPPGRAIQLTFVRTTDETCATDVVFPSLGIKRALPLNQAVAVTIPPQTDGEITFACGMNMFNGQLRVGVR
jgi:hypothetical protein